MIGDLVKAGTKAMGGAQFSLLSVLPGTLVVTVTVLLVKAHAYDFGRPVDPGAVAPDRFGPSTLVVFALAALIGGILLRPFERALVQQLEGYWSSPSPLAPLHGAAVERHRRRRDDAIAWSEQLARSAVRPPAGPSTLDVLTRRDRREARRLRALARYKSIRRGYHDDHGLRRPGWEQSKTALMPTGLGNVLRRAERMAGDRYGLDSMAVYPRLYPHISEPLAHAMARQLDLLTATASLSVSFGLMSAVTLPLLGRLDLLSLVPVASALLSWLAYRGAVVTARHTGELLKTIFDLHRFDLATAFRYKPPEDAVEEYELHQRLTAFLRIQDSHTLQGNADLGEKKFTHPQEPAPPTVRSSPPSSDESQ